MIIIDKLKSFGVEVTEEMEKALGGDWVSRFEMEKKLTKMQELENQNKELVEKQTTLEQ